MVGYPKYLNTKDDYEFVRKNFPKDMWQSAFESLLDTRRDWFNEGEITGTGITDETQNAHAILFFAVLSLFMKSEAFIVSSIQS